IAHDHEARHKKLLAYFVPASFQPVEPGVLREFLKEKLPDYMIPAAFVPLDAMPLSSNGKIDRKALPEPDQSHLIIQNQFTPPQSALESRLADIWSAALKVERVGIHDTFFDLGGHSLLLAQVQGQIEQGLETAIPIVKLFQYPTIASLA